MTTTPTRLRVLRFSGLIAISVLSAGPAAGGEATTFHRDVEPILQRHCQDCHRPGQVAPFSLLSYNQARKRSADIANVTEERTMPPWHASAEKGGPFRGARLLSQGELSTLASWVEAGSPEGNPQDAPPPKHWASDWALGAPDLLLKVPEAYEIGASGSDEYRVFVIPSGLTEGRWISAVDFKPGNSKVVHHILSAYDVTGRARSLDQGDPKSGYKTFVGYGRLPNGLPFLPSGQLGGWAPGKMPLPLPKEVGRYLPAHSDVLLQIHYHKSGKPETDASQIGLYFAKGPIQKQLRGGMVIPPRPRLFSRPELRIPAGDANHEVKGRWTARFDAHLLAVVPHMHWLGKDFRLEAVLPDGARVTLLKVDHWDFNWQDTYDFTTPVALPRGSRVEMVAHFDNSAENPRNQSRPPIEVHWGEQTTDEMCIGFLQLTRDDEHLDNHPPAPTLLGLERLRQRWDRRIPAPREPPPAYRGSAPATPGPARRNSQ